MPWTWRRLKVKALRRNVTWVCTMCRFTLKNVFVLSTGRQVAVDWAVPKDRFLATQSSSSAGDIRICRKACLHEKISLFEVNIIILKAALLFFFQETRPRQRKLRNSRTVATTTTMRRKRRNQQHLRRKSPNRKRAARLQPLSVHLGLR